MYHITALLPVMIGQEVDVRISGILTEVEPTVSLQAEEFNDFRSSDLGNEPTAANLKSQCACTETCRIRKLLTS